VAAYAWPSRLGKRRRPSRSRCCQGVRHLHPRQRPVRRARLRRLRRRRRAALLEDRLLRSLLNRRLARSYRSHGDVRVRARIAEPPEADAFEPLREIISFSVLALELFDSGSEDDQRLIVRTTCSNPTLKSKNLNVSAAEPFVEAAEFVECLEMRRRWDSNPRSRLKDASLAVRYFRPLSHVSNSEQRSNPYKLSSSA
jgi:hypothetical protein